MVTLEITDSRINMLAVQGKQVKLAASLPLEPGLVVEGVVTDSAVIGQRIKELMEAYEITERKVVVAISGMHSVYRTFNLPKLPRGMMDEAVRREIDRVLPVPQSEFYISWQAIPVTETETMICIVGLPRTTVDSISETLREAGLESRIMDVSPLALARVVNESSAIIINAQAYGFDIVVMLDGIPRLLRSIDAGTRKESIPDIAAMIREEFDRTVSFFDSSSEGYPKIGNLPVYIAGEASQAVAGLLNQPITPLPEWFYLPEGFAINDYAVNIGLALKQVRIGGVQLRIDMNVIPQAYRPRPFPVLQVISWVMILMALIFIISMGISTVRSVMETGELRQQFATLEDSIEDITGGAVELVSLKSKLDAANAKLIILEQPVTVSEAQRELVNQKLAKITSLKPGNLELTLISFNSTSGLSVSGNSPDEGLVLNYSSALIDSGIFGKVVVQKLTRQEFNQWGFKLSLN